MTPTLGKSIPLGKIGNFFVALSFFLIVLFLTRQVPLSNYSFIMNIALVLFFLFQVKTIFCTCSKNPELALLVLSAIALITLLALYSLLEANDPALILRFALILLMLILAYLVPTKRVFLNIFILFVGAQAIFLIGFFIFLYIFPDAYADYSIREFFRDRGWGDVYRFPDGLWKIQLKGSALLPVAFMASIIMYESSKRWVFSTLFLTSIVIAGNFAFFVGLSVFISLMLLLKSPLTLSRLASRLALFGVIVIVSFFPLMEVLGAIIESKSHASNPIRVDQAIVLLNDLSHSLLSLMMGRGLGNTIEVVTEWRDYGGAIYYELQWLYIINQIGVFWFSLFVMVTLVLSVVHFKYRLVIIAYLSYFLYSSFNPYFFDTNHIIVIIVLHTIKSVLDEKSDSGRGYV